MGPMVSGRNLRGPIMANYFKRMFFFFQFKAAYFKIAFNLKKKLKLKNILIYF
jgi:hypothetical protein